MNWGNFSIIDDVTGNEVTNEKILDAVDKYKSFFQAQGMQSGSTVGFAIGRVDFNFITAFMAAWEIGATFIVLDMAGDDYVLENNKILRFLPLDFLLISYGFIHNKKGEILSKFSKITLAIFDLKIVKKVYEFDQINNTSTDIRDKIYGLLCTSSGTTNYPKTVSHTHEFLEKISRRNQKSLDFSGNLLHFHSFHHGSSLAVSLLPSLLTDKKIQLYSLPGLDHIPVSLEFGKNLAEFCYKKNINIILIPWSVHVDFFLKGAMDLKLKFGNNFRIFYLYYLEPHWIEFAKELEIEIVSIFGCNETSGPIFINKISKDTDYASFDKKLFHTIDDFYDLDISEKGNLIVKRQDSFALVTMGDVFQKIDEKLWHHIGRQDLQRIRDTEFNIFDLDQILKRNDIKGHIITDMEYQNIYLAIWSIDSKIVNDDPNDVCVNNQNIQNWRNIVETELKKISNNWTLDHTLILEENQFRYGIKLDLEMIRDCFRKELGLIK